MTNEADGGEKAEMTREEKQARRAAREERLSAMPPKKRARVEARHGERKAGRQDVPA